MTLRRALSIAHSNIALIKYWGKSDSVRNLPAVPSLSLTLDGMRTTTEVSFVDGLPDDDVVLDGRPAAGKAQERVVRLLDAVRTRASVAASARVRTANDFPTASGLASSASGFAALAMAALHAAGLEPTLAEVSAMARGASASAARSVFGGFAVLESDAAYAAPLAGAEGWPLRMLVAITTAEPKAVGSTEGMESCRRTSPFYPAWLAAAREPFERAKVAIRHRDFEGLGDAMEASTLMMHATMMAARPSIVYMSSRTLEIIRAIEALRRNGTAVYYTMDAGPHVKALVQPGDAARVQKVLGAVPGVERIIDCGPGPAASVVLDAAEGT